ncbi:hypothetical protein ACLQ3B_00790 [Micromonospora sp. DT53]|uniref:hypothetical protein n=1 Tax=Micromonospora sp. DT53 TaxID=3393444 RepID=UPI003CF97CBB
MSPILPGQRRQVFVLIVSTNAPQATGAKRSTWIVAFGSRLSVVAVAGGSRSIGPGRGVWHGSILNRALPSPQQHG